MPLCSNFFLSRVFKIQYEEMYDLWVKEGCRFVMPFWFPPNETVTKERKAIFTFRNFSLSGSQVLLFKTPDWILNNQRARKMLGFYRLTSGIFFLLFIIIAVITIFMPSVVNR